MRKVLRAINGTQNDLGLTGNNKASAVGGYKKVGQSVINGVVHLALFVRDAGVYTDEILEQPRSVKQVWSDHDSAKVEAYEADITNLKKVIKKAKKANKKSLKKTLAQLKLTRDYYINSLSKASKL